MAALTVAELNAKLTTLLSQKDEVIRQIYGVRAELRRAKRSGQPATPEITASSANTSNFAQMVSDFQNPNAATWQEKGMAGLPLTDEEIKLWDAWVRRSNPSYAGYKNPEATP